jgi:hypothetical protein
MDKFKEAQNNPFDAPIPGQGLTDKPGNYPWEHPPQYTDTQEATEFVWEKLTDSHSLHNKYCYVRFRNTCRSYW